MKILFIFFISQIFCEIPLEDRVGAKCGCGSIDGDLQDNPYTPIHGIVYHQVLKQQMFHFTNLWAQKLKGVRIGKGSHQKVIKDIKIEKLEFKEYELESKNIFFRNFQYNTIQNEDWLEKNLKEKDQIKQFQSVLKDENINKEISQELEYIVNQCEQSTDELNLKNCADALNLNQEQFFFGMKIQVNYQQDDYSNWTIITVLQFDRDENDQTTFFFQPYLIKNVMDNFNFYSQRVNFYDALKQIEYFKSKHNKIAIDDYLNKNAIRFLYNGFYTHQNQNEIITSCRFGYNIIKYSIQMILQLKEFPSIKFNFCPKQIQLFEYSESEFYLNEKMYNIIDQQEQEIENINLDDEINEFNEIMSYKDFPVNLEYRYQDQIDKVFYIRSISEEYDINAKSDVDIDCEAFQRAREYLYFHDQQLLKIQYLNLSPNFEIVCMKEEQSQASTSRAMIFYYDTLLGYVDFETYLSETDPCKVPFVCVDFEANFGSQIVSQINCQRKAELDINLIPNGVGMQQYFYHIVYKAGLQIIENCINELEILNSLKIGVYEFTHLFLANFSMEIKSKQRKLQLIFDSSFQQEKYEQEFFFIGNFKGGMLMGFFEKFEYAPIYFTIRDFLWEGYIQLEIRCGTQYFKVMFPNQIFISKQEIQALKEKIIAIGIKDDYITKRKELYHEFMQFKIHEAYDQILIKYFQEVLYASESLEYNSLVNKIIKNDNKDDIIYPNFLQEYLDSGFIGFPVIVSTFNYILLNFSFDRLSTQIQYDIKSMIQEFNSMMQYKSQDSQNDFWSKYNDINAEITEETYPEEFPQEQKNNLGFNDLSQWIYVLESQEQEQVHDLGYLEYHLEEGFDRINDDQVIKFSSKIKENSELILFDLQYLKEKQILFNNNYFLGLFGNNEFHRKMIFEVFFYNYSLMSVIQVKFQTENFTSEYILPINSYVDLIIDFQEIAKNIKNHGLLFEHQSEKTLTNQRRVSFKQIYKSLLKVFKDITDELKEKENDIIVHDRLVRFCQDPESFPLTTGQSPKVIDIREEKVEYIDDNVFTGQCKTDQNQNFLTIEEQEELIIVNVYEARKFKEILKSKKLGQKVTRNFISTYTFHRKAAYNILPIFERQMYCLIYHVFLGKFCEKELHWNDFVHTVNLEKHHKLLDKKKAEEQNQEKKDKDTKQLNQNQQTINELISLIKSNVDVNLVAFQKQNRRTILNHARKELTDKLTKSRPSFTCLKDLGE